MSSFPFQHSGKSTAVDNLPIEELAETAIRFLQDISSTFINIACAEAQLKLMETLASYGGSSE